MFLVPSPYFFFVCLDLESFDGGTDDVDQILDWLPSLWHRSSSRASRFVKILEDESEINLENGCVRLLTHQLRENVNPLLLK
jgi:hypothetical protein